MQVFRIFLLSASVIVFCLGVYVVVNKVSILPGIFDIFVSLIIGVPLLLSVMIPGIVAKDVWLGFWSDYLGSIIGVFGSGMTAYLIFNYQQKIVDEKELNQKKFELRPNLMPISSSVNLFRDKDRKTFLSFEYATFLMRDSEYPLLQDVAQISKHHILETNKKYYLLRGIILNSKNNKRNVYRNLRIVVSFKKDESRSFYIQRVESDQMLVLKFQVGDSKPKVNPEVLKIDIYLETLYEKLWINLNEDGTKCTYLLVDNKLMLLESEGNSSKELSEDVDASFSSFIENYEKLWEEGKTNRGYYRYDLIVAVM